MNKRVFEAGTAMCILRIPYSNSVNRSGLQAFNLMTGMG